MKFKQKESEIQKSILDFLEWQKEIYFFRAGSGLVKLENGRHFKSGKPGVPDIIVVYEGRFIGLEVKTETGRQSEVQKEAEEQITDAGGEYYIVRSIDDVKDFLEL